MLTPRATRPEFPPGYLENPKSLLPWSHVEQRLTEAKNYWICSVRPNSHPHAVPKWAVWLADRIYFDGSPETRHARNIAQIPHVIVHLESGDDVVIVEGIARASDRPSTELADRLALAYANKYAPDYAPSPDTWDNGGLFEVIPQKVIAWTKFTDDPTRFILTPE
jgi:nitroimidazol reductase NimA-like FMN-containing flavoprotein (pyridoxamine 5'-phosphate oxidase superfamily)